MSGININHFEHTLIIYFKKHLYSSLKIILFQIIGNNKITEDKILNLIIKTIF
ncbi:hypothetical protein D3C85_1018400 [compost metagenome]